MLFAQLPWHDIDGFVDRWSMSPHSVEEATKLVEQMSLALEDNMDYPVASIMSGGSLIINTAVRGRADVVLVVTIREFRVSMVASEHCWLSSNVPLKDGV